MMSGCESSRLERKRAEKPEGMSSAVAQLLVAAWRSQLTDTSNTETLTTQKPTHNCHNSFSTCQLCRWTVKKKEHLSSRCPSREYTVMYICNGHRQTDIQYWLVCTKTSLVEFNLLHPPVSCSTGVKKNDDTRSLLCHYLKGQNS